MSRVVVNFLFARPASRQTTRRLCQRAAWVRRSSARAPGGSSLNSAASSTAEETDAFLPHAWIDDAARPHRYEVAPRDGVQYHAAVDPSGGGPNAFTLFVSMALVGELG